MGLFRRKSNPSKFKFFRWGRRAVSPTPPKSRTPSASRSRSPAVTGSTSATTNIKAKYHPSAIRHMRQRLETARRAEQLIANHQRNLRRALHNGKRLPGSALENAISTANMNLQVAKRYTASIENQMRNMMKGKTMNNKFPWHVTLQHNGVFLTPRKNVAATLNELGQRHTQRMQVLAATRPLSSYMPSSVRARMTPVMPQWLINSKAKWKKQMASQSKANMNMERKRMAMAIEQGRANAKIKATPLAEFMPSNVLFRMTPIKPRNQINAQVKARHQKSNAFKADVQKIRRMNALLTNLKRNIHRAKAAGNMEVANQLHKIGQQLIDSSNYI